MWSLLRGKVTGAGGLKRRVKGGTKHLASPTFAPPTRSEDHKNRLAAVTLTPDSRTV